MIEPRAVYLDASAIVKLIVREPASEELSAYLMSRPTRFSSRLVDVEVRRAAARIPNLDAGARIDGILARISRVELGATLAAAAAAIAPPLRTLDAIHLASATVVGPQLEALVTYDERLADAGRSLGVAIASPGA